MNIGTRTFYPSPVDSVLHTRSMCKLAKLTKEGVVRERLEGGGKRERGETAIHREATRFYTPISMFGLNYSTIPLL